MTAPDARAARDERHRQISDLIWDHAFAAIDANVPHAEAAVEDVHAAIEALVEALDEAGLSVVSREAVADYLLTHVGGDEAQPWQAGHNYAMREAARLIRERWDAR